MQQFKLSALLSVFVQTVLLLCLSVMSVVPTFAQNDIRVTYIHTDADGTPFAATDEQGNVEWQVEHQPYGKEHSNTEVRRESTLSFAGKAYDEEIGLSYFGGRWYSPELGRFMGIDPVGVNPEDWKTFNRYSYGFNNPYKYVDPDGNLAFLVPIAIFLAKEGLAEVASRATGGATDFLSVRRLGSKVVKKSLGALKRNRGGDSVGLDTNAVIAKLEGDAASKQAITSAISGRTPRVSPTAAKEFLKGGGSSKELRGFLSRNGGGIAKSATSQSIQQLTSIGVKNADARVVGSAIREGTEVLTRDKKLLKKASGVAKPF